MISLTIFLSRFHRHSWIDDFENLFLLIIFTLTITLIILSSIISFIKSQKENKKHNEKVNHLLKNGKEIEIDLKENVVSIVEIKKTTQNKKSGNFKNFVDNGFVDIKEITENNDYISYVYIKYLINNTEYIHKINLPMCMENVVTIFKFQKKATLIYDPKNPQNCIVDLGFAT